MPGVEKGPYKNDSLNMKKIILNMYGFDLNNSSDFTKQLSLKIIIDETIEKQLQISQVFHIRCLGMGLWWLILITISLVSGDLQNYDYYNPDNEDGTLINNEEQRRSKIFSNNNPEYDFLRKRSMEEDQEKRNHRFHSWGGKRYETLEPDGSYLEESGFQLSDHEKPSFSEENYLLHKRDYMKIGSSNKQQNKRGKHTAFSSWGGKRDSKLTNENEKPFYYYSISQPGTNQVGSFEQYKKRYPAFRSWAGKRSLGRTPGLDKYESEAEGAKLNQLVKNAMNDMKAETSCEICDFLRGLKPTTSVLYPPFIRKRGKINEWNDIDQILKTVPIFFYSPQNSNQSNGSYFNYPEENKIYEDIIPKLKRTAPFNSLGGKRVPAFNSWGGKRSDAFNSEGEKTAQNINSWGEKRDNLVLEEDKRNFEEFESNQDVKSLPKTYNTMFQPCCKDLCNGFKKLRNGADTNFEELQVVQSMLQYNNLCPDCECYWHDKKRNLFDTIPESYPPQIGMGKRLEGINIDHTLRTVPIFLHPLQYSDKNIENDFDYYQEGKLNRHNSRAEKEAAPFNIWEGKRTTAFNSWGGKRTTAFNSWGGKRTTAFNSWGEKREPAFKIWGGKISKGGTPTFDENIREVEKAGTNQEGNSVPRTSRMLIHALDAPFGDGKKHKWSDIDQMFRTSPIFNYPPQNSGKNEGSNFIYPEKSKHNGHMSSEGNNAEAFDSWGEEISTGGTLILEEGKREVGDESKHKVKGASIPMQCEDNWTLFQLLCTFAHTITATTSPGHAPFVGKRHKWTDIDLPFRTNPTFFPTPQHLDQNEESNLNYSKVGKLYGTPQEIEGGSYMSRINFDQKDLELTERNGFQRVGNTENFNPNNLGNTVSFKVKYFDTPEHTKYFVNGINKNMYETPGNTNVQDEDFINNVIVFDTDKLDGNERNKMPWKLLPTYLTLPYSITKRSPIYHTWNENKVPKVLLSNGKRRPAFSSWGGKRSEHKELKNDFEKCVTFKEGTLCLMRVENFTFAPENLSFEDHMQWKQRGIEQNHPMYSNTEMTDKILERDKRSNGSTKKNKDITRIVLQRGFPWPMMVKSFSRGVNFYAWGGKRSL